MIGKAKACIGGFSLYNYVIDELKGYELMRNNLCGETAKEIFDEMKIIQGLNQNSTNKLFSFVLSPHLVDGQNLSKKQLREVTENFLKNLNFDPESAQFLAFAHTEKAHRHIHILMNRVNENGKLFPDNHIGKKAQWAAHKTAMKFGLVSAKQMRLDKIKLTEKIPVEKETVRKTMFEKHIKVKESHPKTMGEYLKKMHAEGLMFIPTIMRNGDLQGFRIRDMATQVEVKASDVHRDLGLKRLIDSGMPFTDASVQLVSSLQNSQEIAFEHYLMSESKEVAEKEKFAEDTAIDRTQDLSKSLTYMANSLATSRDDDDEKLKQRKRIKR